MRNEQGITVENLYKRVNQPNILIMFRNFKEAIMPLVVVVLGAAAAFATNAVKQNEVSQLQFEDGYHYDATKPEGERCTLVGKFDCDIISGTPICTDANNIQVWGSDDLGMTCSIVLYQRAN